MSAILTNILALIFVLGVMIFVHELGHHLMAKAFGIGVETFSFGFGKRLFGFKHGDTDYRVSLLPLGGYVKMRGENPDEELTGDPDEYLGRPKWQRFFVLIMGPAMNVVLALALFITVYVIGVRVDASFDQPVVVGWVEPDSPARDAGLLPGDRVLGIDGETIPDWEEFRLRILMSANQLLEMDILREGREVTVPVTPRAQGRSAIGYLGVIAPIPAEVGDVAEGSAAGEIGLLPGDIVVAVADQPVEHFLTLVSELEARRGVPTELAVRRGGDDLVFEVVPTAGDGDVVDIGIRSIALTKVRRYSFVGAVREAFREVRRQTALVGEIVGRLFTGRISLRTLSGPVEIARFSGSAARSGDPSLLISFMAVISLQLGLLNLLPIPILDGGQIALLGFEGLIRRDLSMKVKERIMQVGFLILIAIMVVVLALDISKSLPESWARFLPF